MKILLQELFYFRTTFSETINNSSTVEVKNLMSINLSDSIAFSFACLSNFFFQTKLPMATGLKRKEKKYS